MGPVPTPPSWYALATRDGRSDVRQVRSAVVGSVHRASSSGAEETACRTRISRSRGQLPKPLQRGLGLVIVELIEPHVRLRVCQPQPNRMQRQRVDSGIVGVEIMLERVEIPRGRSLEMPRSQCSDLAALPHRGRRTIPPPLNLRVATLQREHLGALGLRQFVGARGSVERDVGLGQVTELLIHGSQDRVCVDVERIEVAHPLPGDLCSPIVSDIELGVPDHTPSQCVPMADR